MCVRSVSDAMSKRQLVSESPVYLLKEILLSLIDLMPRLLVKFSQLSHEWRRVTARLIVASWSTEQVDAFKRELCDLFYGPSSRYASVSVVCRE